MHTKPIQIHLLRLFLIDKLEFCNIIDSVAVNTVASTTENRYNSASETVRSPESQIRCSATTNTICCFTLNKEYK